MKKLAVNIGAFFAITGVISSILYLIDYNVKILAWIDSWGTTMGWIIRLGLIVIGVVLFFVGSHSNEEEPAAPED